MARPPALRMVTMAMEYLVYKFGRVWVKSWELSNKDGDELPEETVVFYFDTCRMEYYPQRPDGSAGQMQYAEWDFGNQ